MKSIAVAIFSALLFFLLTPGILLSLPSKGGKYTVALVHAVVFAVIFYYTSGMVWRFFHPAVVVSN
jgi:hypothetical protein